MNPQDHIEALLKLAAESPCSRDKRGAIVVRDGDVIGRGFNAPVGGACSDDVCHRWIDVPSPLAATTSTGWKKQRICGGHAEHAEAMAMRMAIERRMFLAIAACTDGTTSPVLSRCELIHLNTAPCSPNANTCQCGGRIGIPSRRRGCPSCAVLASGFGVDAIWLLHEDGWKRWSMAEYAKLAGVV